MSPQRSLGFGQVFGGWSVIVHRSFVLLNISWVVSAPPLPPPSYSYWRICGNICLLTCFGGFSIFSWNQKRTQPHIVHCSSTNNIQRCPADPNKVRQYNYSSANGNRTVAVKVKRKANILRIFSYKAFQPF